ncbi:preprotein translocase subunit SecG, partial [Leptospirillum ferriphilum]
MVTSLSLSLIRQSPVGPSLLLNSPLKSLPSAPPPKTKTP